MKNKEIINEEGVLLSPESLKRHPRNRTPVNIEPLAENIYANGLLTPLRVTEASFEGKHYIIAGERRWTAINLIRQQHPDDDRFDLIPCQLSHASTPFEIATEIIADNMDRENPNSEEFRRSVFALDEEYESASLTGNIEERKTKFIKRVLSSKDLSERQIRRYASIVSNSIPEIKQAAEDGVIPLKVAEEISSLDSESQLYIFQIINDGGKVNSDLISLYKKYKTDATISSSKNLIYESTIEELQAELDSKEKELEEALNGLPRPKRVKSAKGKKITPAAFSLDQELIAKASRIRAIGKASKELVNLPGSMLTQDLERTIEQSILSLYSVLKKSRDER